MLKKEGLEEEKIKQTLDILLETKFKSEFREISTMVLPKSLSEPIKNWEQFVMNFCLDVNEAFKTWSGYSECIEDGKILIFLQVFCLIHQHTIDDVFGDEFPLFVYPYMVQVHHNHRVIVEVGIGPCFELKYIHI